MTWQVTGQGLADGAESLEGKPTWSKRCGVYVGCMFVDHMMLLQSAYGFSSTGPVMTGEQKQFKRNHITEWATESVWWVPAGVGIVSMYHDCHHDHLMYCFPYCRCWWHLKILLCLQAMVRLTKAVALLMVLACKDLAWELTPHAPHPSLQPTQLIKVGCSFCGYTVLRDWLWDQPDNDSGLLTYCFIRNK